MVGSSNANLFASISAGICALWGPLHGGANEACVLMLERILADGGNVKKFVDMAKDKKSNFRLMGFGHRVYKTSTPAASSSKKPATKSSKLKIRDPCSTSPSSSKTWPSATPTSSSASSTPTSTSTPASSTGPQHPRPDVTVLFAMGRLPGWIAHWVEMHASPTKADQPPAANLYWADGAEIRAD